MSFEEYAAKATWYVQLEDSTVVMVLNNHSPEGENPPIPEDGNEYVVIDYFEGIENLGGWRYINGEFLEPLPDPVITTVAFVELFTPAEFMAIEALLGVDAITTQLYKVAELQGTVDMSSPKVTEIAFPNFVTLGIMTQERADEIVNSWKTEE